MLHLRTENRLFHVPKTDLPWHASDIDKIPLRSECQTHHHHQVRVSICMQKQGIYSSWISSLLVSVVSHTPKTRHQETTIIILIRVSSSVAGYFIGWLHRFDLVPSSPRVQSEIGKTYRFPEIRNNKRIGWDVSMGNALC